MWREDPIEILFESRDGNTCTVRYSDGFIAIGRSGLSSPYALRRAFSAARRAGAREVVEQWLDAESGTQHFILA